MVDKIVAMQNEATRAVEVPPEETTSRSEGWSYRSQRDLETALDDTQHDLAKFAERAREAERNELAYRRKVDELTRKLEVSRERVRELSSGKTK